MQWPQNAEIILKLNLMGYHSIKIPSWAVKIIFLFGVCSTIYNLKRIVLWPYTQARLMVQSRFNSSLYLKHETETEKEYGVIYGACNNAGKAFAKFLAEKGFSLILIDRNPEQLGELEEEINNGLGES